ncbi:amino acid adenylation domain-containing protein/non-ribosomal peptide synthase protein (TIGR01720 family) [Oxalobacteraceae bacterium GrIS 1.11]
MRNIDDLLDDLAALGVSLHCEGAQLRVRGPAGATSAALREEIGARKGALIAHLQATSLPCATPQGSGPGGAIHAGSGPRDVAPLSFNQRRLWFLDRLEGGGNAFVLLAAWRLDGPLDRAALERAISALVGRHELLRSVIEEQDGQGELRIAPAPSGLRLACDTLAGGPEALAALLVREANTPFALDAAPPFRARLATLAPHSHVLTLALHHIAADHWSMGVLIRELGALYSAFQAQTESPLAAPALQYSDYALWQRAALGEPQMAPHLAFWRAQLADAVTELALPLDRPRPNERGDRAALYRFALDAAQERQVQAYALRCGATPFMVLLAAYALLLSRWSGQDDLLIGCPVGHRERAETHGLVGFFIDTMPLRIDLAGDPSLDELVGRVRATCLAAFAHQELPFERIVHAVKPERALNRAPLFQTMFVLQNGAREPLRMAGLAVQALEIAPGAPELDINFSIDAHQGAYACQMEYDADLFDAATIAELARQFCHIVAGIAHGAGLPMSRLALAAPPPSMPMPVFGAPAYVPALIARAARAYPERPAIVAAGLTLSYRQLMAQAAALGDRLVQAGVVPGDVVGLGMGSGPALVVAMLAVWRARAAYVVLSPAQPAARRAQMIASAGVALVLTTLACAPQFAPLATLLVDPAASEAAPELDDTPDADARAAELAYVCFTSGSSGAPKGVAVTHANLGNHARAVARDFGLGPDERVLQFAAADFDVAGEEIFPTLAAGACLVLRAESDSDSLDAFNAHLLEAAVTVVNLPAAFWHEWVRALDQAGAAPPASLRLVVTGSDRVLVRRLRQWQALCRHPIALRSGYGPTEATITAAFFDPACQPIPPQAEILPLGRAIDNVWIEVVDAAACPVPPGVLGEILISGAGVAQGYLGLPEQTAARFLAHPRVPAMRSYRSGDLARRRADGTLEFVGRQDGQAKVRGFRIELGEIEAALLEHPRVREAAILLRHDAGGLAQLVAVAALDAGAGEPELAALSSWLAERLPAYMVPPLCIVVAALPRTSSGKLDQRALAALPAARAALVQPDDAMAGPAGAAETALARLFAEVLELPAVGMTDNVFELGIDSIRSLQIVARARQLGMSMTVRDIFRFQTIRALVQHGGPAPAEPIGDGAGDEGELAATPIQAWFLEQTREHSGEHGGGQRAHYNQSLVLRMPRDADGAALERALGAVQAHHPMLRLHADGAGLRIGAAQEGPWLTVLDLSGLDAAVATARRAAAFAEAQQSMDLARGRLLRAVLLPASGRLMIAVHHLAIDAYSWSILLDDLALAYEQAVQGRPIVLPAPSSSYRDWSGALRGLAAEADGAALARDFTAQFGPRGGTVLAPEVRPGLVGEAAVVALALDADTTAALLQAVPRAFGARVDEALLAALALAAGRLGVGPSLRLDLERNGRADLFAQLDLSRSIGWHTAVQAVALNALPTADVPALLRQVCAVVRSAPHQGLGMGVLRYLSPDPAVRAALAALPDGEILLNYLGRLDLGSGALFAVVDESSGAAQGAAIARSHVLEMNVGVWNACMKAEISFPAGSGHAARVARLADEVARVLREIAACATATLAGPPAAPAAADDECEETLPLTPLQQGILFHSVREPDLYYDQLCIRLDGALDAAAWRRAWELAVARHGMLRTSFHWRDGPAMLQRVHRHVDLPWVDEDWRAVPEQARPAALKDLMARERARGFALEQAPLMRLHLLRCGEEHHELLWGAHHLLLDGWSVSVLMGEIFTLYRQALGEQGARLAPAPPFGDYVRWQQRCDGAADGAYWRRALDGLEEPTSIAFARRAGDSATPATPDHAGALARILPPPQTQAVQLLARRARVTVGTVLQAAWGLLLARCSASRDVLFGVTVSGRPPQLDGVEAMIGMLIATVPARVTVPRTGVLLDWLGQLQEQHLEREQHAAMPLTQIKHLSAMAAGVDLFETLLLIQNYPAPQGLAAAGVRLAGVTVVEKTNYPLTLSCITGQSLELMLHYDDQHIAGAAAHRLLEQLVQLLLDMAAGPERQVWSLLALDESEARAAHAVGVGPAQEVGPAFLAELVEGWARRTPQAPALVDQHGSLSYFNLDAAVNRLARALGAHGVGGEARVAICLPRSPRYVIAVLAVLRCGAAFVPLDPAYPAARRRYMLDDSGAAFLITDPDGVADLAGTCARTLLVDALFDAAQDAGEGAGAPAPSLAATLADSLAYVIYTSGSTGAPKGVANTHGGMRALAHAQRGLFALGQGDRVLQFAALSFDASVWEMTMALGAGAALLLPLPGSARPGPDLQQLIADHGVTAATLPPTALATLERAQLSGLRTLVVAGEVCPPELARHWAEGRRFFNAYGPTEASVCASIEEGVDGLEALPIGRPLPNVQMHVLDEDMRLLPPGVAGELYIGGAGLARGYLNRPQLNAASFLPDPFGGPGQRLYRTGDRGYRLADGRVQFIGRLDHQVKLRGFRIELGEIEATLLQHGQVRQAVLMLRRRGAAEQRLCAYVATDGATDADALRAFLSASLPEHMIPAYFTLLPALPLTASGKIDRAALERIEPAAPAPAPGSGARAPSELEARLGRIWATVLGLATVDPEQNFFALGGDSILAIQVVAQANRQGLAITLNQIMDGASQTVAALAALLAGPGAAPAAPALALHLAVAPGPVPLTPIQHWFLAQGGPDRHHYNQSFLLAVPADLDAACLTRALNALQGRHDALRLRLRPDACGMVVVDPAPLIVQEVAAPQHATVADWRAMLEAAVQVNQGSLDLEAGPLIRLVLFAPPAGMAMARLHIVLHHLAVDAVSWRILLDDLFHAYAQARRSETEPITLAPQPVPFSLWAGALERYAASAAARAEAPFWLARPAGLTRLPGRPADGAGFDSTVADAHTVSRTLDQAATTILIRTLPRRHGGQVQEVLLAALGGALGDLLPGPQVLIALEAHGRDMALEGLDASATLGWMTVLAPLLLPLQRARSLAQAIESVRAALRALPGRGLSFGVLRYLSPDPALRAALAALPTPDILFNYLGQWDSAWPDAMAVQAAPESDGSGFAPTTPRAFALEINALVAEGTLRLDLSFDPRLLEQAFVEQCADGIMAWLAAAIADTPAQQPEAPEAPQESQASFALGPQQAAMFAHALAYPASRAYAVQFSARLPADLRVEAFTAAWERVLARHAALRASFATSGADGARQRFSTTCAAPWQQHDWSALPRAAAEHAVDEHREAQRASGFDLTRAPLMRFSLLRLDDGYRFIWTYHHLLLDGWSVPIILAEVLDAYAGKAVGAAAPDVRDFLAWLAGRDHAAARVFWRAELAGLNAQDGARWPATAPCSGSYVETQLRTVPHTGARLAAYARQRRLSLPSVLLQAWACVLAQRSGRAEVCFGVTSALRPAEVAGVEAMVGALLATHPLRHSVAQADPGAADFADSFAEACLRLQRRRVAASKHAILAPAEMAACAGLADGDALFGSVVRIQNYPLGALVDGQAALAISEVAIRDDWHYPFNLEVTLGDDMHFMAVYDAGLLEAPLADALLAQYGQVLAALVAGEAGHV